MFTGLLPSSPSGSDSDDEDECVVQKKVDESCNSKETTSKGEHRQKLQAVGVCVCVCVRVCVCVHRFVPLYRSDSL